MTGGCCRENRPPPRSLQHRVSARGPSPDAQGSRRSCRAGSVPGSARHGTGPSSCEMQAGSSPGRLFCGQARQEQVAGGVRVSPQVGLFLTPDLSHFPSPGPGIPRCATDRHCGHRELAAWKLQRYKKHMCLCGLLNCHLLSISSLRPAAQGSAVRSSSLTFSTAEREGRRLLGGVPRAAGKTHGAFWRQGALPQAVGDARCRRGQPQDSQGLLFSSCPGFSHGRAPVERAAGLPGSPSFHTCTGRQSQAPRWHGVTPGPAPVLGPG